MRDGIQPGDPFVGPFASKYPGCQERPVQAAVVPDEVIPKSPCDLVERRLTRFKNLSRNSIRVGNDSTLRREHARHRRLARTDAPADRDDAARAPGARHARRANEGGRASPAAQSLSHPFRVTRQLLHIAALMQELELLENPHHQVSSSDADSQWRFHWAFRHRGPHRDFPDALLHVLRGR